MKRPTFCILHFSFLILLISGCSSYKIVQTNHFVNDDGAIVRVDYGRAEKDHVNTFLAPTNRREMEFKSKLVVEVTLPKWPDGVAFSGDAPPYDGERFTAWRCMNLRGGGTTYKADDEEWYFLASGFTCRIARRDDRARNGYRDVFSGVLCNTPLETPEKDSRWHKIRPDQNVKKKE